MDTPQAEIEIAALDASRLELTDHREWTEPQRRMMRRAGRHLATVWGAIIMATTLTIAGAPVFFSVQHREFERKEVRNAVEMLQNAKTSAVPFAIKDLQRSHRSCGFEELEQRYEAKSPPGAEVDAKAATIRRLRLAQALASYGAFDMHGNVWEWCWDGYAAIPAGDVVDPVGPNDFSWGSGRVLRGGCWSDGAAYCRTAYRNGDDPSGRVGLVGFRLALSFFGVPDRPGQDKKK